MVLRFYRCETNDETYSFAIALGAFIGGIVGIASGLLICVAGTLGIASYKDPQNYCKNGFHMAFSILAWFSSAAGIGVFSLGLQ